MVTLTVNDEGFGVLDDNALKAFTHGQCHSLALAINKLTGWPIKGASYNKEADPADSPAHVLIYSPKLRAYVDIRGVRKTVGKKNYSEGLKIVNRNIAPEGVSRLRGYLQPNLEAAMPFAKSLLKQIGVEV